MDSYSISSVIGTYVGSLICLLFANWLASGLNDELFERNTMKIGLKWVFWRSKKADKEMYIFIFIHQLIGVVLFLACTTNLILSIVMQKQYYITFLASFIFGGYVGILDTEIKERKKKRNRKN